MSLFVVNFWVIMLANSLNSILEKYFMGKKIKVKFLGFKVAIQGPCYLCKTCVPSILSRNFLYT